MNIGKTEFCNKYNQQTAGNQLHGLWLDQEFVTSVPQIHVRLRATAITPWRRKGAGAGPNKPHLNQSDI